MAAETRISASELAHNLSDVLSRVKDQGEQFVVERNGEEVARLVAPLPKTGTLRDLIRIMIEHPVDDQFADDLEKVHADMNQPLPPLPDWPD